MTLQDALIIVFMIILTLSVVGSVLNWIAKRVEGGNNSNNAVRNFTQSLGLFGLIIGVCSLIFVMLFLQMFFNSQAAVYIFGCVCAYFVTKMVYGLAGASQLVGDGFAMVTTAIFVLSVNWEVVKW